MRMSMKNKFKKLDDDPHGIEPKNKKDGIRISEKPRTKESGIEYEDDDHEEHGL